MVFRGDRSLSAHIDHRLRLSRYEIAMGYPPFGADDEAQPLPPPGGASARLALERAVLAPLARPPCVVSFSGGRDSSAVLAVAAHVARREGLPLPVPVTLRFPGVEGTDESSWQEQVVRHLGLEEWERINLEEIDFLGPIATSVLRRHGLLWPANTYFHVPILQRATGGSLLTGVDGDGLLSGWRWPPVSSSASLHERARRWAAYAVRASIDASPPALRNLAGRRQFRPSPWIRTDAWPEIARQLMAAWELEPRRWDERLAWWSRRRYLACTRWSMALLAADHDVEVSHPLLDPGFLAALAREGGSTGLGDRTTAMHTLFADILPDPVLHRHSKAYFDGAMWGPYSRTFIDQWDGSGIDTSLVDADRLRREWQKPMPLFTAASIMQSAWLTTMGDSSFGT